MKNSKFCGSDFHWIKKKNFFLPFSRTFLRCLLRGWWTERGFPPDRTWHYSTPAESISLSWKPLMLDSLFADFLQLIYFPIQIHLSPWESREFKILTSLNFSIYREKQQWQILLENCTFSQLSSVRFSSPSYWLKLWQLSNRLLLEFIILRLQYQVPINEANRFYSLNEISEMKAF